MNWDERGLVVFGFERLLNSGSYSIASHLNILHDFDFAGFRSKLGQFGACFAAQCVHQGISSAFGKLFTELKTEATVGASYYSVFHRSARHV
mmetsp:Transcript_88801/g.248531  ORF Transcript_88801/g.248531 Transcript_88801/m.248531 type:complete len:92 (-) Transcript_88801:167-442(-)